MADTRKRFRSDTLPIRVESGRLILPETIGSKVENMYFTEEGTLRAVWGPSPYVPNLGAAGFPAYLRLHGIFHCNIGKSGEQEILLIQTASQIWVFEGWNIVAPIGANPTRPWRVLLGPASSSPQRTTQIGSDRRPRFPAQFEKTPNGVVIIPTGETARPYFYDGDEVLPLGYASPPGAPSGWGPESDDDVLLNANDSGFSHTGANTHAHFRDGRVGSVDLASTVSAGNSGRLAKSTYRAAVQWVDRWGNLSPMSGKSAPLKMDVSNEQTTRVDSILHYFYWTGIEPGPEGTIGRILLRTKDEVNSGTLKLFEMSNYAAEGFLNLATIPDNVTRSFPDNVPDAWLVNEGLEVDPVRPFRLYKVAFGRGWAANFDDDPGKLQPTLPGRWGTFESNTQMYPDPQGAQITGLAVMKEGLLVFTDRSTYIIIPFDSNDGFSSQTLHPSVGCSAPSSIASMPDGSAIWLGREGFYRYSQGTIEPISLAIGRELRTINRARRLQACAAVDVREGKYRCWVAMDGSERNNVCWEFDGDGWTRRNDVEAAGVCVSDDHRHYMLAGGRASDLAGTREGVWLLDYQNQGWAPAPRAASITTGWLRAVRAQSERGSPMTVYLWFRETESGTLNVEVERDWRANVTQTASVFLHPQDDFPPFWGDTEPTAASYGGTDGDGDPITWKRRRPYWTRADVFIPSAEVFRLRITHTGDWEFLGVSFDEVPRADSFRSSPK